VIVVARLAAHVEHGIDRRRPADHLAARVVQAAPVEALFRQRGKHPVGARIADGEQVADRHVIPDPIVAAAGLQHQDAPLRIGREAVRQQAAGRACADDDGVVVAVDERRLHRHRAARGDQIQICAG
jgi:hypothetical protein